MARKKILFVITKSNFGGAQRYVYELAAHLPTDQYDVAVASGGHGELHDKLNRSGIRTHTIESFQRDIDLLKEFRSFMELWRLYRNERPDIVHLNSSKAGGSGAFIARLAGVPRIVYTAHGWPFWEPRPLYWRAIAWLASWVTALLCHDIILVSEHERSHTRMPFVHKKIRVIHTAVPAITFLNRNEARTALFSEADLAQHAQDIWLITNAELNHNKNLAIALDAVAEYNRRNDWKIFYSIIGDGELRTELAEQIELRGLTGQAVLLGYVDNAREYLQAFDIFLLPSLKEGLPYALLEAGAAGLPSIASLVGGIPEVIAHEKHGLLIDPHRSEDITVALKRFSFDTKLRNACGEALKERVVREFSLEEMTAQTEAVYTA